MNATPRSMIVYHGYVMRALAAFALPEAEVIDFGWEVDHIARAETARSGAVARDQHDHGQAEEIAARAPSAASQPILMDLPVSPQPCLMTLPESGRRAVRRRGHAGRPGSGPQDETCGSCIHYRSVAGGARRFPKCDLTRKSWTNGSGSDIRRCDPACDRWASQLKAT